MCTFRLEYLEDEDDLHLVVHPGLHQEGLVARVLGVPLHPRDVLVVPPLLVLLIFVVVAQPPPHTPDGSVRARVADADEQGVSAPESARWGCSRVREGSAGDAEAAGAGGGWRDGRCGAVEVEHHAG